MSYDAQKSHRKAAPPEVKDVGPGVSQTWFQVPALLRDREGGLDHPGPACKRLTTPLGAASGNARLWCEASDAAQPPRADARLVVAQVVALAVKQNAGCSLGQPARKAAGRDPCRAREWLGASVRGLSAWTLPRSGPGPSLLGCSVLRRMLAAPLISRHQRPVALPSCGNQNFL